MPTKKKLEPRPLVPQPDYWERFLESLNLIGSITQETEVSKMLITATTPLKSVELTPDQWTFCYRVSERLTGPMDHFLDRAGRSRVLKIRQQTLEELEGVFKEKETMEEWFTRTRQKFNLKEYELTGILYESLEGLKSEEAKELKEQLKGVYNQLVRMRTIGPTG